MIYGRLVKVDRSSLNNQKLCDYRGWKIGLGICDLWEIGKGLMNQYQQSEILWSQGMGDWDRNF